MEEAGGVAGVSGGGGDSVGGDSDGDEFLEVVSAHGGLTECE